MADADGTVTVTGSAVREDVDALLTLLHRIPGVEHVINRLTINESAAESRRRLRQSLIAIEGTKGLAKAHREMRCLAITLP